jgi:hypothetical protein
MNARRGRFYFSKVKELYLFKNMGNPLSAAGVC